MLWISAYRSFAFSGFPDFPTWHDCLRRFDFWRHTFPWNRKQSVLWSFSRCWTGRSADPPVLGRCCCWRGCNRASCSRWEAKPSGWRTGCCSCRWRPGSARSLPYCTAKGATRYWRSMRPTVWWIASYPMTMYAEPMVSGWRMLRRSRRPTALVYATWPVCTTCSNCHLTLHSVEGGAVVSEWRLVDLLKAADRCVQTSISLDGTVFSTYLSICMYIYLYMCRCNYRDVAGDGPIERDTHTHTHIYI